MKRLFLSCVFILSMTAASFGQATTFYYPHVAIGVLGQDVWKTSIFLTNPAAVGTATASGSITFYQDNSTTASAGAAFSGISFVDETGASVGSGNTISFQIAGGQSKKFTSFATNTYAGGFAVVTSNAPVTGTAIFSEFTLGGQLIGEAGVPAGSAVTRQIVFVDTNAGYNLGFAVANPGTAAATLTLNLLNTSAVTVQTTTRTLGTLNHLALFTSQLFPNQTTGLAGTMQIVGTVPLTAIALRFDPTFSIFTTLPPVTIASLTNDAIKWFQDRPWTQPIMSLSRLMASLNLHLG